MSNSAISSAKRRRAAAGNLLNSPLFQSPNSGEEGPSNAVQPQETAQNNRPVSIQQAIYILNGRILQLERTVAETRIQPTERIQQPERNAHASNAMDETKLHDIVHAILESHLSEFNHRYEMLASEILNLKHIVMKLQSYTLDINKTLIQERIQILSDIPNKAGVSMIEVADDLNLRGDIANMIGVTTMEDTFDMQNEDMTVEDTTVEDTTVEEENAATISCEIEDATYNENLEIQLCESAR